MKKSIASFVLYAIALVCFATEPLYVKHDYIKGSMPIMTNVESFVSGSIEIAREGLQAEIDNIATNPASIASNIIEEAVITSSNYTDKAIADGNFATKPEIPTKTSQLENDGNGTNPFLTEHQSLEDYPTKGELRSATNDVARDIRQELSTVATDATNYTVSATNDVMKEVDLGISASATESTNYTDSATNEVIRLMDSSVSDAATQATNYTNLATSDLATTSSVADVAENLSTNYYTKSETDDAIDTLAAYYITYNSQGDAFPTLSALTNAATYYSGGKVRTPTRNDYAVVLADEAHGGSEWRYIYTVAEGATQGQWDAQYPIETNDYEGLGNKPQINGHTLTGNMTADELGLSVTTMTTNDVCSIVTNVVVTDDFTEWKITPSDGTSIKWGESLGVGYWYFIVKDGDLEYTLNPSPAITDSNAVEVVATGHKTYTATRSKITLNALGLARLVDLPPLTNWMASVEMLNFVSNALSDSAADYTDDSISTNNPAFVAAVTNCPVIIAPTDATELGEYGTYGTIGAVLLALAAGLAALKKGKVDANSAITGGTNCKITYDSKGLVTGGSNLEATDIPEIPSSKIHNFAEEVAAVSPPTDISGKLESTSAAPAFSDTASYVAGEYVTKDGVLYCFTSAHSGAWTGTDVIVKNMTAPDATVDIMADGSLRVVMSDGTIAWQEGYGRSTVIVDNGSAVLSNTQVNYLELPSTADADTTISLVLPQIYVGDTKTKDLILDVANLSSYTLTLQVSADQLDVSFGVFVRGGDDLQTIGTIAAGEYAELYFTQTKFTKTVNSTALPVYMVSRQTVEDGGVST